MAKSRAFWQLQHCVVANLFPVPVIIDQRKNSPTTGRMIASFTVPPMISRSRLELSARLLSCFIFVGWRGTGEECSHVYISLPNQKFNYCGDSPRVERKIQMPGWRIHFVSSNGAKCRRNDRGTARERLRIDFPTRSSQ